MRDAVADQNPWDVIVSSPLLRCSEFAKELAQRHTIPLEFDDRIKEIRWGEWEGSTPEQLNQHDPLTVVRALRDPLNHRPSDAEDINDFQQRVIDAWNAITNQHEARHVLVVAHAGIIRAILTHILETPSEHMFRIHVSNASVTRIQISQSIHVSI